MARRSVVLGLAAVAVAGCGSAGDSGTRAGPADAPNPSTPDPESGRPSGTPAVLSPPPQPPLLPVAPWQPGGGEVEPAAKLAAARHLETMTPAGLEVPGAGPSTLRVVYPQYGGLTESRSSVMTVLEQTWRRTGDGMLGRRLVSVDVRLTRDTAAPGSWRVTDVLVPPVLDSDPTTLDGEAANLAASQRVRLPGPAVADLAAGLVHPRVVSILLSLSRTHDLEVSVFASAHPVEVFGTSRTSNHTRGRAVDVWAVDGRRIADTPLDDPALLAFLDEVRALGSDEIGGPVDRDGPGGVHFADALHRDHIHIGLDP